MALKTKELTALGLDWGTWIYDCESGLSTIIAADIVRITIEIDVDVKKITEGLSKLLPGAAKEKLEAAIKALAKKLPKGKVKLAFQISARAGATPCIGGKRLVHAQVDLSVRFEAEVTVAGGAAKVKGEVTIFESLESYKELCDCKVNKKLAALGDFSGQGDDGALADSGGGDSGGDSDTVADNNSQIEQRRDETVDVIDSIGSTIGGKLQEGFNLSTLGQLAAVDTSIASKVKIGVSENRLKKFKLLAGLLVSYPSLTPEGADTIVNGLGVKSLDEFFERAATMSQQDIVAGVEKAQTPADYQGEDVLALALALQGNPA